MTAAGQLRTGASRLHVIQRHVTGPLLEGAGGAASRSGFWIGLGSNIPSGIGLFH